MNQALKYYEGRIPACGVFCGGCPVYTKIQKPCPGAGVNLQRCENCKSFHLCCKGRNIANCYQCKIFPCSRFKRFAQTWLKYGQDLIANQHLLGKVGHKDFLKYYNAQVNPDSMKYTVHPIQKITEKRKYYPFLLDADPSETMIEKYLKKGEMFAFEEAGITVGVIVMFPLSGTDCELKNMAVLPERQQQGIGRWMIEFVAQHYQGRFKTIYVGTGGSGVTFYQKCGFMLSHRVENFFTDHYEQPIVENGVQMIDMVYLKRDL